jgi:malic enzyme
MAVVGAAAVAVTAAEIAEAASVVEADAIAEVVRRAEICLHRNTLRPPVRHARRIHRTVRSRRAIVKATHRRQPKICRRLFCPANRWRNIANVQP